MLREGTATLQRRVREKVEEKQGLIHRWAHVALPSLVLLVAVLFYRTDSPFIRTFQLKVFDRYQHGAPRPYDPDLGVRILDLDDETLERLGQWPWPRTLVAELVDRLAGNVAVVAFDVVFAEPDRTSPTELARSLPASLGSLRNSLRSMPDSDSVLAASIRRARKAGTSVAMGFTLTPKESPRDPVLIREFMVRGGQLAPLLPEWSGAVTNRPVLEAAIDGSGSINSTRDDDGVTRRVTLPFRLKDKVYPSLSLEALRLAARSGTAPFVRLSGGSVIRGGDTELDFGGGGRIVSVAIQPGEPGAPLLVIPTDHEGSVWLHFTDPDVPRTVPVWKVFEKDFDPSVLGGGIVFVGTSSAGLKDLRATPRNSSAPGVELHAQLAEQVMAGHYLERPNYAEGVEIVFFVVLGIALIALMRRLGAVWCAVIAAGAIAAVCWLSWKAFLGAFGGHRFLFDPILPSLVVLAVYITSSLVSYLRNEAEKRQVRGAFSRYMSPDLVEQLAKDPSRLKLGGEMREMTLMFSDIRGFTTISEQFDAHGLTTFINKYLTPMTQIVLDHKGTIDKYMGDCIMAFWNAPLDVPGHEVLACRGALKMIRRMNELNDQWKAEAEAEGRKYIPVRSGIGVNSGPCCVGNMGSDMRFDYSVLGDDVNLASRLEGQSKSYGVDIVLGAKTKAAAAAFATLELDLIKVKGKTVPVHIYCLLGDETLAEDPRFKALAEKHAAMLAAYRGQRWDETDRLRLECEKESEALDLHLGKLYHLYQERLAQRCAEPPAADWNGVFRAISK